MRLGGRRAATGTPPPCPHAHAARTPPDAPSSQQKEPDSPRHPKGRQRLLQRPACRAFPKGRGGGRRHASLYQDPPPLGISALGLSPSAGRPASASPRPPLPRVAAGLLPRLPAQLLGRPAGRLGERALPAGRPAPPGRQELRAELGSEGPAKMGEGRGRGCQGFFLPWEGLPADLRSFLFS